MINPPKPPTRWTNFPQDRRRRNALRSSAEGTQANNGRVVHPTSAVDSSQRWLSPERLWIDDPASRRRRGVVRAPSTRRPYKPQPHGPVIRLVQEGKRPPNCIHCGGATELASQTTSCFHIERAEQRWQCVRSTCLGRADVVIYRFPRGEYERRC